MTMVDDGSLSLDQPYTYQAPGKDETRAIRDWMDPMITYSDNRSTQALLQLLHRREEVDAMNADFGRLGLGTLQINGTDPRTGGNWQPGEIHMTALDTARLLWLIDGAPDDYVLWQTPEGDPVTSAELSDSSRAYLKNLLAQQGYNEALSTSNFGTYERGGVIVGAPNTLPGIPSLVPDRWINPEDGTVTVDGVAYGQDVRFYNDNLAEVSFAHKTGLTYNYGSDAGIVESLPGQPYRHYIIAYLSNLGYRYTDEVFADRTSYPYLDPVGGIAYTQRIPSLGKAIDDGIRKGGRATPPGLPPVPGRQEVLTEGQEVLMQPLGSSQEPLAPRVGPRPRVQSPGPHPPDPARDAVRLTAASSLENRLAHERLSPRHRSSERLMTTGRPWEEVIPPMPLATT